MPKDALPCRLASLRSVLASIALVSLGLALLNPRVIGQTVDHTARWENGKLTYGLFDTDNTVSPGRIPVPTGLGAEFIPWGNIMSRHDLSPTGHSYTFTRLTPAPYSQLNDDLFFAAWDGASLSHVTFDSGKDLPPASMVSWFDGDYGVSGGAIDVNSSASWPTDPADPALVRKLHFRNELLDISSDTPRSLDPNIEKVVVLIHGWNPGSDADSFATPEFTALRTALQNKLAGSGWALVQYHWEADSDTGIAGETLVAPTKAAHFGHMHGQHLGDLLYSTYPKLRSVHLIAHSAGSWAARAAARHLKFFQPDLTIQVTLLDPFMPAEVPLSPITTALGKSLMDALDEDLGGPAAVWRLENYYAKDVITNVATEQVFAWDPPFINARVDWTDSTDLPVSVGVFDDHAGPIKFYADTVYGTDGALTYAQGVLTFANTGGIVSHDTAYSIDSLQPYRDPADNKVKVYGWVNSLFRNEAIIPDVGQPKDVDVVTDGPASFSVAAANRNGADPVGFTYRWYKDGVIIDGAISSTYAVPHAQATNEGLYSVLVTNGSAGGTESRKARLRVGLPVFNLHPMALTRINLGDSFDLSANATGAGTLTYSWQVSTDRGATWQDIQDDAHYSGATTRFLHVTNADISVDGARYRAVAKNALGSGYSKYGLVMISFVVDLITDGSFEATGDVSSWPNDFSTWGGDNNSVVGTEQGISPATGGQMLSFLHTVPKGYPGGDNAGSGSSTFQLVDVSAFAPWIATGKVRLHGSAKFNVVPGDDRVNIYVLVRAYGGAFQGFDMYNLPNEIGGTQWYSDAAAHPNSWMTAEGDYSLPPQTTYVGIWVSCDTSYRPYTGMYADDVTLQLSIPIPTTVTLANMVQKYDGQPHAVLVATLPANVPTYVTYNGSATPPTEPGTYHVQATINDSGHDGPPATGDLIISRGPEITLNPGSPTVSAGTPVSIFAGATGYPDPITYQWFKDGVLIPGVSGNRLDISNATVANAGDYYFIAFNGVGDSATSGTGHLTVNRITPVVTWGAPVAMVYGSALGDDQYQVSHNVAGTVTCTPAKGTILNAGLHQPLAIRFTPADPSTYTTVDLTAEVVVNLAPLNVTADDKTRVYGAPNPPLTLHYSGFVNGETPSVLTEAPVASTLADVNTPVGTYGIIVTGGAAANYNLNRNAGILTITPAPATVMLDPTSLAAVYSGNPVVVLGTTSPFGLWFSYTYNGSPTPPTAAGSYTVVATILDGNHTGSTTGTLVIAKATPLVTWGNPAPITADMPLSGTQCNATANVPGSFAYTPAVGAILAAGTQTLSATFTPNDAANYSSITLTRTLTVNPGTPVLTISDIPNQTINVGTSTGAISFTIGGAQNLTVTSSSANQTLIPDANVVLGGSGTSRTVTVTPVAAKKGSAVITVTVSDGTNTASDTFTVTVDGNTPPTISDIPNIATAFATATSALGFTVGDDETTAGSLTLAGASSNPALVPNGNITFGGAGANRTVTVTPAGGQSGSATITVTVSDGQLTANDTFVVTVAANTPPTLSHIAAQSIPAGSATGDLGFTIGDAETPAANLTVTGTSSDQTLIPGASITFSGTGANRFVKVTTAPGLTGTATITLTVSDGNLTTSDSFVVVIYAHAQSGNNLYGIGDLPGGVISSEVRDATKVNGVIYAVGAASANTGSTGRDTAVLWTSTVGLTALPNLVTNTTASTFVTAAAITPDGAYIASRARSVSPGGARQAVRVTTNGLTNLSFAGLVGGTNNSAAVAISSDGSVVYGLANGNAQAARYTVSGPTGALIPFLNPGDDGSSIAARGCSTDGSVAVGTSVNSGTGHAGAFRYVQGTGVSAIPYLAGGTWNQALSISPDGNLTLVVGDSPSAPNGEYYLHNAVTSALTRLGTPNGSWGSFGVGGMTADGSVVALNANDLPNGGSASFIHNSHGWHDFQAIVAAAGIDLSGWVLDPIAGISSDGTLAWGMGTHNGNTEGWVVELTAGSLAGYTEPATYRTPGTAIVGAWSHGDTTTDDSAVIFFLSNGYYVHVQDVNAAGVALGGADGYEVGQYTWDAATGGFTCRTLRDTNGSVGVSGTAGLAGVTVTVSGNTATAVVPGDTPTVLTRVVGTSAVVGAWVTGDVPGGNFTATALLPNGTYFLVQEGPAAGGGTPGIERGTYAWNSSTGDFTATPALDTNGAWGLSSAVARTVTTSDDLLTLTVTTPSGSAIFSRSGTLVAPVVTVQPFGQTVNMGKSVTFTAAASGYPTLTYQWRLNGVNIFGATGSTYTIPHVTPGDTGVYTVVVTNAAGATTSAPAALAARPISADLNGDGKLDLLWQNTSTGERSISLMDGSSLLSKVPLGTVSTDWLVFAIADFNGDGQMDLLWRNTVTGEGLFWLMNGSTFLSGVSLGVIPVQWQIAGAGDFNGDGKPDIVWQNTRTGERIVWLLNGTTYASSASLGTIPPAWAIAGVADFNNDGQADLLWTNTRTGELAIWLMNGTAYASSASLGSVSPQWQVASLGDYDGDGNPDILWTNTLTGERVAWLMNGPSQVGTASLGTVSVAWTLHRPIVRPTPVDFNADGNSDLIWQNASTGARSLWLMNGPSFATGASLGVVPVAWQIATTGDFNGDGHPDILWQNTATGDRVFWLMDGTLFLSKAPLGVVPTAWSIAGSGDFNGDGQPDLVWENTATGERYIWMLSGTNFALSVNLGTVAPVWHIAGTGDFNGDGQTDLVWENTATGDRYLWLMNGATFTSIVYLCNLPVAWHIAGTGDYNGDGQPDLIWENTATGDRYVWLMNGATFSSSVYLGNVATAWHIRN